MSFTIHFAPWFLHGFVGFIVGVLFCAFVLTIASAAALRGLNI